MDFSAALLHIKAGKRARRAIWKNVDYVFLVPGSTFTVSRPPLLGIFPEGTPVKYNPHIDCVTSEGTVGVWNFSMADILAQDWEVAE